MTASMTGRPLAAQIIKEAQIQNERRFGPQVRNEISQPPLETTLPPPSAPTHIDQQFKLADISNANSEELSLRAYFLCMAISNNHKMKLSCLLESKGLSVQEPSVELNVMHAVKLLTCTSLFFVGIESGGLSNSKASVDLLLLSFRFADRISPCSPTKQLISLFGDCTHVSLKQTVARLVVQAFSNDSIDIKLIDQYLQEEMEYRKDISLFACEQKVCVLRDHLLLFA